MSLIDLGDRQAPDPVMPLVKAGQPGMLMNRRVAAGALLMVVLRLGFRLIGIVSTLVLVRLLQPADFGLVAIATVIYSVLDTLSDLSFEAALIRMTKPERAHYDTAWTIGVARGVLVMAGLLVSAPSIAHAMHDDRLISLFTVLAAVAFFQSFQNVGIADFQRDLQFSRVFWFRLVGKLTGTVATIVLAISTQSYWSLIIGAAAGKLVLVPLSYKMHPFRPRIGMAGWQDLVGFSKWLMAGNLLQAIDSYVTVFIVGRIGGPTQLGIFQVAAEVAALPASEIAAPMRPPLYASYVRLAKDTVALRKQFLTALGITLALIMPASVGICLTAQPITLLVLGAKWAGTVPLIKLFALVFLLDAIGHSTFEVFMAVGQLRRQIETNTVALIAKVCGIIAGASAAGVIGAVEGILLASLLGAVLLIVRLSFLIGIRMADLVSQAWRTVTASAVMTAAVLWFLAIWPTPEDATLQGFVHFVVVCLLGATIHIVTQSSLWWLSGFPTGAEAHIGQLAMGGLYPLLNRGLKSIRRSVQVGR